MYFFLSYLPPPKKNPITKHKTVLLNRIRLPVKILCHMDHLWLVSCLFVLSRQLLSTIACLSIFMALGSGHRASSSAAVKKSVEFEEVCVLNPIQGILSTEYMLHVLQWCRAKSNNISYHRIAFIGVANDQSNQLQQACPVQKPVSRFRPLDLTIEKWCF